MNLKFNDKGYILFEGDCFDYFHLIEDKSIDMILTGSKHATVYRFIEAQMKELRRTEKYGF